MSPHRILAGGLHAPLPEPYESPSAQLAARVAEGIAERQRAEVEQARAERLAAETIPAPASPAAVWPEPEGGLEAAVAAAGELPTIDEIVESAETLIEAWTASARRCAARGEADRAALLEGCIADLRVLFAGTSAGDDL